MLCDGRVWPASMPPGDDHPEAAVLPISCVVQRRLVAACVVAALSLAPLTAQAAGAADVDALWNQPQGVGVDSAFYVVQAWWDGVTRATSDPTHRGLAELAQANADLLNSYTVLQQKRSGAGAQPVVVIDPFLSGIYNFITGSNAKAPVGSLNDASQSTVAIAAKKHADDKAKAKDKTDKGHTGIPQGNGKP